MSGICALAAARISSLVVLAWPAAITSALAVMTFCSSTVPSVAMRSTWTTQRPSVRHRDVGDVVLRRDADEAGGLGAGEVGDVDRVLAAVVHAERAVAVGVGRLHLAAELAQREVPVDRHRDLRHLEAGAPGVAGEDARRLVRRAGDQLVGGRLQAEHGARRAGSTPGPCARSRAPRAGGVEDVLGRLERHPLVDQGTAADARGAHDGHAVAVDPLQEPGVRLEAQRVDAEQRRRRTEPEDALVRGRRVRERLGVRPRGPADAALEDEDRDAGLARAAARSRRRRSRTR